MLMIKKTKLVPFLEPASMLKRIKVKLSNDWPAESRILKRLLVNHQYRFIYCPINKNASTSMMAALLNLNKQNTARRLDHFNSSQTRLYVSLNYSFANYTYAEATRLFNLDYFKFVVVRNPWARLVSTYANYFVRLPLEEHIFSDIAKSAAKHIYGEKDYLEHLDSITFEQFVQYVSVKKDAELDIHCKSQVHFLNNFDYDFMAKVENLDEDLTNIEERLKLPLKIKRFNKTTYSDICKDNKHYFGVPSSKIRSLKSKTPSYRQFYNPELAEMVESRYAEDIDRFEYSFR